MMRLLRKLFGKTVRETEAVRLMAEQEAQHADLMHKLDESTKETVTAAERVERAGAELLRRLGEDIQ